jgi:hypothetical protein
LVYCVQKNLALLRSGPANAPTFFSAQTWKLKSGKQVERKAGTLKLDRLTEL